MPEPAAARISVGEHSGLRVPAAAVHYLKEDGTEAETQGENYVPGVYVKLGNIARFCRIDPVDADHPLITDGRLHPCFARRDRGFGQQGEAL